MFLKYHCPWALVIKKTNIKASPLPHPRHSKIAVTNDLAQLSVLDTRDCIQLRKNGGCVWGYSYRFYQLKVARPTNDPNGQRPKSLVLCGVHLGANESHQRGFPATVAAADPWSGERIKWQPPHRYVRDLTTTTCYALKLENRFMPSGGGQSSPSKLKHHLGWHRHMFSLCGPENHLPLGWEHNPGTHAWPLWKCPAINYHKCHVAITFRSHWVASGRVKFKLLWLVYLVMFSRYSISWMQFITVPIPKIDAYKTWTSQQGPVIYQPWNLLI